jgi:hypothetical protein
MYKLCLIGMPVNSKADGIYQAIIHKDEYVILSIIPIKYSIRWLWKDIKIRFIKNKKKVDSSSELPIVGEVSTDEGMCPRREPSPSNDVHTNTHRNGHAMDGTTIQGNRRASLPNDYVRANNPKGAPSIAQMLGFQQ